MEKKYELTDETKVLESGEVLHRIRALRNFSDVSAGDLGGFVSSEYNLSHDGECWIYDHGVVCGRARVRNNARVADNAIVRDYATVYEYVVVGGGAIVCGNAIVADVAIVRGSATIAGNAIVYGNAIISGVARLGDNERVGGKAYIINKWDVLYVKGLGSAHRGTTMYKTKDGGVEVVCGCFRGSLDEFENEVVLTHGDSKFAREYLAFAEVAKIYFGLK